MPKPGYTQTMTPDAIRQRQEASRTHGAYAIRDRGEEAMTPVQRSKYAELQDQLSTRAGALDALKDAAVNCIMLAGVAQSYCIEQHKAGKPLDRIPLLAKLPVFWNAANRALKTYLDAMPDESKVLDLASTVKQAMSEGEDDS